MKSVVNEIAIKDKLLWSIEEASKMTGIGVNRLRELASIQDNSWWVVKVGINGGKTFIKKRQFEKFINNATNL